MSDSILGHIRIVDLSWGLAGPVATRLLAEAGADVIKVEPPGGDPLRDTPGFASWNRSKRSVVLDLRRPQDRQRLDALLEGADVFVHCLRPRDAQQLGLDDASLGARFSELIVCGIGGYPIDHPDAERPGYDILVQARMGLMDEQQGHRDGPVFLRFPIPSWGAVYLGAAGILARLLLREREGTTGPVHTSLLQGALITLTMHWARAEEPGPAFRYGLPKSMIPSLFQCGDGRWVHVMAPPYEIPLMKQTIEALEEEEVEATRNRRGDRPGLWGDDAVMETALRKRPAQEWLEALWAADVPILPAQHLGEILRDEQATLNGYVNEVNDPVWGRTLQAGTPFDISPPARITNAAPALDEHAHALRAEAARAKPPLPRVSDAAPGAPLAGIKVLDMGNFLAGPFAAMLLGDLGAEVIKLEAISGDKMRGVERVFAGCQRGKRGIAVDLKNPAARPVVERLVKWADVVHHNLRYPAARKLGVDYETLHPLNPRMIYCHTSAYGPKGPRADWPGFDQLFQAYSGWEVEGGGEGNPPMWHRMGMMDHQNALASLVATLLALLRRQQSGEGQFVSASILGASTLTASETLIHFKNDREGEIADFPHLDSDQTGLAPHYRIYRCEDGWLAVAALRPAEREGLQRVLGADPEASAAARKLETLHAELHAAGVPNEPVALDRCQAFFDSAANRDSRLAVEYPHAKWGRLEQIGALWDFVDRPLRLDRAPPGLGEHSGEILGEIGFNENEISELAEKGAVSL